MSQNIVDDNSAIFSAGAYTESYYGSIVVVNNIAVNNKAINHVGGIFVGTVQGKINVINNTIVGNSAPIGGSSGGIYVETNSSSAQADLHNNIIWGNSASYGGDIYLDNGGTTSAYYNDFDPAKVAGVFTNEGNNINADPLFVDASNGDYHLSFGSPAIDAGTAAIPGDFLPPYDIDRDSRVNGLSVDIGADESLTAPIVSGLTPTKDTTPTWTWISVGGGNGTFRYRLDSPNLSTGATMSTMTSFTSFRALSNGSHTLYVQERNAAGFWSATGFKSILIDTTLPTNGTVTATPGPGQIDLSWSGYSDALSGITNYKVVYATGNAPVSCSTGTVVPGYDGTSMSYTHTGLINQIYGYRVCAIDRAGNMSTGAAASAKPLPKETNPPVGSIVINGGAAATKSGSVSLTLTASDDSPPVQMCISSTTSCFAWTAFASTKTWTLPPGNGTKTVYAWFRDTWGNTTAVPYTDTIILDTTLPTNGTVTATPAAGQITLNWSGFGDTGSGLNGYVVRYATGSVPISCSTGTVVPGYDGTSTSYTHTGLINQPYGYRVCGIDKAGNISTGVSKSAKPLPKEVNPPTGSIVINGGAEATKSASVTLTLTASDDSPPVQMCISSTTSCYIWTAFAGTKTWTLLTGSGVKTVYVWFRDIWGNATATPYTDTIILDTRF